MYLKVWGLSPSMRDRSTTPQVAIYAAQYNIRI